MKYESYKLHQMKVEDLRFKIMWHLLIIIVIKLWKNIDSSWVSFSGTHCIMTPLLGITLFLKLLFLKANLCSAVFLGIFSSLWSQIHMIKVSIRVWLLVLCEYSTIVPMYDYRCHNSLAVQYDLGNLLDRHFEKKSLCEMHYILFFLI